MRARAPRSTQTLTQTASDCTGVSWHTPFIVTEIRHHSSKWLSLPAPSLVLAVKRNVVVLKGMGGDEQYCARTRRPPQSCEQRGCRSVQACSVPVRRRHRQGVVAAWGRGVRAAGADRPAASSHPQTPRARLLPLRVGFTRSPPSPPTPPCPAARLLHTPHSQARQALLRRPTGGLQPEFNGLVSFKHLVYFKPQGHIQKAEWGNFTPML